MEHIDGISAVCKLSFLLKVTLRAYMKYDTFKIYAIRVAILPLFSSLSEFFYFGRKNVLNKGVLVM